MGKLFGRNGNATLTRQFRSDESGMALIYVTLMLPVIVGFSLLAVDASRVFILQSSLQHGADAIALAMAAELDHTSDALTRADAAKDNLVSNPALFTSFASVDTDSVDRRFLSSLPASDKDPITAANVTTDPKFANYVEVKVKPAGYNTIFPASFIGGVSSLSTTATAIAGMDAGACNVVPMFICNPLEPTGNTNAFRIEELQGHVAKPELRRRLIELKAFANSAGQSQFSPGNFGYVETPLGKGARGLNDAISQAIPGACITLNGLTTKPGNTTVTNAAFNTRFDMYGGSFKKTDGEIRPARNTRKSWKPKVTGKGNNIDHCTPTEITDLYTAGYSKASPFTKLPEAMGFPRDSCMISNSCGSGFGGRLGGGDWNGMFETYMETNFPGGPRPTKADGGAFSASDLPSRYDVYRAEIEQAKVNNASMALPKCYANATTEPNDAPDRRLFFAAIANCIAEPIGSGSTTVNAVAFGRFFLTEPVGSQGSVYAELISIVKPGSGGGTNGALVTDNVQLYR